MLLGLLKMIFKPAVKNTMKQLGQDKEFLQAIEDQNHHAKKLKDLSKKLEDHPDPKIRELAEKLSR